MAKTLGIIHASHITIPAVAPYLERYIPGIPVMHLCDDTIQRDNLAAPVGEIPKRNYGKFAQYAHNLEEAGADLLLLACSTFNYAAELARPMIQIPILQIDRPMMEAAVQLGDRIGLLATLPSTVPSSERLLRIAAEEAGREIHCETVLCAEAFAAYSRGEVERHNALLLQEIETLEKRVDCIVMAQLSMSALVPMLPVTRVPVLSSGDTCFKRLKTLLGDETTCR